MYTTKRETTVVYIAESTADRSTLSDVIAALVCTDTRVTDNNDSAGTVYVCVTQAAPGSR